MMAMATTTLPLRLAVEPWIREYIGTTCFILPSTNEDRLCFIITNQGLLAFVLDDILTKEEILHLSQLKEVDWPKYTVIRCSGEFYWYLDERRCSTSPRSEDILDLMRQQPLSISVAKVILESITRYYSRQVLEPSIRGFLGILEKQFPRNDLYLFELLQNAVDDGASTVVMKSFDLSTSFPGLFFCHNGRSFSPLDILGLASVGLSTKGVEEKKKIGFMGVGFKAVYKRFSSVTIYDHVWNLQFQEPSVCPIMEPSHSWVMKPSWISNFRAMDSIIPQSEKFQSSTWCHFILERPRGGADAIRTDLKHLSSNVPVLLGRQFLFNSKQENLWRLIWETTTYQVTCHQKSGLLHAATLARLSDPSAGKFIGSAIDSIDLILTSTSQNGQKQKLFQFLTVYYYPPRNSQTAFELHTKKVWSKQAMNFIFNGKNQLAEEVSLFFELGGDGLPIVGTGSGKVHAILPTKLQMPCCIHLQGSWLLSVDRQDVQNISENDWNNCLINQFSRLLVLLARWIADQANLINSFSNRSHPLKSLYRLFPKLIYDQSKLQLQWLNQNILMEEFAQALKLEKLIPVYSVCQSTNTEIITFCDQSKAIWLPSPMMKFLSARRVHLWFSRWPFVSHELDDLSREVMWTASLEMPTAELLRRRKKFFVFDNATTTDTNSKLLEALTLLAAFGSIEQCLERELYLNLIPPLEHWPIFLTEEGECNLLQDIVWFSPDERLMDIDAHLYSTFRKGALLAVEYAQNTDGRKVKRQMSTLSSTYTLLDPDLEIALRNESHPDLPSDLWNLAKCCVKSAQLLFSSNIVNLDSSCSAILTNMALEQSPSLLDIPLICKLFYWALKNARHIAISHLLVNKTTGLKLIPSREAYVKSLISEDAQIIDLLPYVSDIYLNEMPRNDSTIKLYRTFLKKCGCQIGISLVAKTRSITSTDRHFLPNNELPKLRQSNPSVPLALPFNLGPITKKRIEIIDVTLSPEWESIMDNAASDINLAVKVAQMICDIFKHMDVSSPVTSDSTPYLKDLLLGRSNETKSLAIDLTDLSHRIPSDNDRYPPPAFARMFYLPPAQPGAEVINLGPAQWVHRIARSKWVPAVSPGSDDNSPSMVLAPCEVLLTKDSGNAHSDIMPMAMLQAQCLQTLQSMPPPVMAIFAWGTVAPPPPLDRFISLCIELTMDGNVMQGIINCSKSKYNEISNLWISLLISLKEKRLSVHDKSRISKALQPSGRYLHILPGFTRDTLVSTSHCVAHFNVSEADEDMITLLLCQVGYLFDLTPRQREDTWILTPYISDILTLLSVPKHASPTHVHNYLSCYFSEVSSHKFYPPSPSQKLAFSYSLWILIKNKLSFSERETLVRTSTCSPTVLEKIRNQLRLDFPLFALYCRCGHGLESSNIPGEWINIWSKVDAPKYHPILIDDRSVTKGAYIDLDHCLTQQASPKLLDIEKCLRMVLDIPSITDSKYFSLAARSGGDQVSLPVATCLFRIVIMLIFLLDQSKIQIGEEELGSYPICRCDSLSLVFRYPKIVEGTLIGLHESVSVSVYAIRGAPIKPNSSEQHTLHRVQPFLITGNSNDYVPELEELTLSLLYGFHRPTITSNIRKALSLLNHLESAINFLKYFDRYFPHILSLNLIEQWKNLSFPSVHKELVSSIEQLRAKQSHPHVDDVEPQLLKTLQTKQVITSSDAERKNIGAAESFLSSLSDIATDPPPAPSRSLGRGICNLPSWMTTGDSENIKQHDTLSSKKRPIEENINTIEEVTPTLVEQSSIPNTLERSRGRGRGICNLPSWMSHESLEPENKRQRSLEDPQFEDAIEEKVSLDPFSLLVEEIRNLVTHSSNNFIPLPLTVSKLTSFLSTLSEDRQLELKQLISGPLKQEIMYALQKLETPPSSGSFPYLRLLFNE